MNTAIFNDIIELLPRIEREDERLDEEHGINKELGLNVFDPNVIKRVFDENEREAELDKRLMTYDYETLLKAEALLYYGRDRESTKYTEKLAYCRNLKDSKAEIVRTIIEKLAAFHHYITYALRKLQQEGLTIESI